MWRNITHMNHNETSRCCFTEEPRGQTYMYRLHKVSWQKFFLCTSLKIFKTNKQTKKLSKCNSTHIFKKHHLRFFWVPLCDLRNPFKSVFCCTSLATRWEGKQFKGAVRDSYPSQRISPYIPLAVRSVCVLKKNIWYSWCFGYVKGNKSSSDRATQH